MAACSNSELVPEDASTLILFILPPGAFIALAYLWPSFSINSPVKAGMIWIISDHPDKRRICKQHCAVTVPGDLSVPRGIRQGVHFNGDVRGGPVCHDDCHDGDLPATPVFGCCRWGWTTFCTITFILVIAALVQMVEIVMKKVSPPLYQALGVFLPLITTNCAVLGVAILALGLEDGSLVKAVFFAISSSAGFALALVVFASIRQYLELAEIPEGMKGVPINLLVAGLLSLAFLGFAGLVLTLLSARPGGTH